MEKLGPITILAERKVQSVEMDFDVDDKTLDIIARHGIRIIAKDKQALFEYVMRKAIENFASKKEKTWKLKKAKKDSSKRSSRRSRSRKS